MSDADRSTLMADNIFSFHQEDELVNLLTLMHNSMFTLSEDDIRSLVYEYATLKGIIKCNILTELHNGVHICKKSTSIGDEILEEFKFIDKTSRPKFGTGQWVTDFLLRNARKLSPINCRPGAHINSQLVANQFFEQFRRACEQTPITPDCLYNAVELKVTSQISGQQIKEGILPEFIAVAEICGNASGAYMAPTLIFPRLSTRRLGWLKPKSFFEWFVKFLDFSKPTQQKPVLLLIRGDAPFTKSVKLMMKALENHVRLFCHPLHRSQNMQPLDVSFTPKLSAFWFEVLKKWQTRNSYQKLTRGKVLHLFLAAFNRARETELGIDGFLATGIYPLDKNKQNRIYTSEGNAVSKIQMQPEYSGAVQMKTHQGGSLENRKRNLTIVNSDHVQPKVQKTKNVTDDPIIEVTDSSESEEEGYLGVEAGTDDCEYISTVHLMDEEVEDNPWEVSEDPEKDNED